ncbi:uncharacterized protein K460DRAFT_419383 [Cucurbitaria berberidis CBS 394.84]|uniref:Uncharacterized protein n=1 Tax=Cucurbitaria berberidis CBS 394.84 TaxID=1168544 RepID=A0A9P4L4G7_9PLEO|nr:uncharacterized protein K460DRAFT_419383 [Cucurbitaria berberidis CBS 394.84]KAF1841297.1 hypothetical protein K460DRAFT_419383 [Cucurbitaria berberidis CBS 394.84]
MSFAASFGVDIVINAVVLGATLLPPAQNAKVRIGCGSKARKEQQGSLTGGGMPDIVLYDTHGEEISRKVGGGSFDPGSNPIIDMGVDLLDPGKATRSPEYVKLVARGNDAVCIGYVAATSAGDDKRTWHAGYAKECARHANANFWYPSPEIIPGTDFRPGCIWMSSDERFLQAISVKLTDFAFPTSDAAEKAKTQFEQTPNTLCQAPGRMSFWKKHNQNDCIPFYDFTVERNETTGFDIDYQKIVSGHTLPCKPRGLLLNQILEPGKGPETLSPEQIRKKEQEEEKKKHEQEKKNEDGENPDAPPPGTGSFGGQTGTTTQEENNEKGINPNGPPPGTGSFGGVCGVVPASSTAKPGEFVSKVAPCPSGAPVNRRRRDRRQEPPTKKDHCVDRLVISYLKDHSAREVCDMKSSWGPDFVSIPERLHCNMCTRQLSRLCEPDGYDNEGEDCFDLEKRVMKRSTIADSKVQGGYPTLDQEAKSYVHVSEWKA